MALRISFSILSIALLASCISAEEHSGDFGYNGPNGPDKWGSISPSFAACSNGKAQSPVNIRKANIVLNKQLKSIDREYHPANATLVNNKVNIGVHFEGKAGHVIIEGKKYFLKQMHWHCPSEHRINGRQYDAELHQVHETEDGSLAVVGVLYKVGRRPSPIISKIEDKLVELDKENRAGHKEAHIALGTFGLEKMKGRTSKYYRYVGSLTTPPCTEGVNWNVNAKVKSLSKKQLELLKAPLNPEFKYNARPVQPLNGRKVEMFYQCKQRQ
ncbi:alpha carbonic anhydrase 1, chloroplastic [Gastrolobium bilobum]|uniref:alpha carbonic anhydrase 1, chloroplastic n=1 Tax=Gastrolobium bilobum TaxID=150636 RepID=UPI002AB00AFA|nr:alpha carbonic anhydrase 1, chloroplastic [Gastrolobium bilobum]